MTDGGLVALFGRRVDPRSPFLREWDAVYSPSRQEWWCFHPSFGRTALSSGRFFASWREALAAVRAAEAKLEGDNAGG